MEILNHAINQDTLTEQFASITRHVSAMMSWEGVVVRPFLPGMPFFSKLSLEQKQKAIEAISFYRDLCQSQIDDGYKLKDSLSLTWRCIKALNLTPRSDLFSYLTNDHVVEIYSRDHIQLFRNLKFFEICSYTLEELLSNEWWVLYHRDENITQKIFQEAQKIFSGEVKTTFEPEVPRHILREIASFDKLSMYIDIEKMSPMSRGNSVEAAIVLERCELISN